MVVLSEKVWCDPCIAPLVKALNEGGIATVASCCGHGERNGSICLADGRELLIRTFTPHDVLYAEAADRSRISSEGRPR